MIQHVIDFFDGVVSQFLNLGAISLFVVFGNQIIFFQLFYFVKSISADIPDGYFILFRIFSGNFNQFFSSFFGKWRNWDADKLSVRYRIKPEVGLSQGFFNSFGDSLVPDADGKGARIRNADCTDLGYRCWGSVCFNHNVV